MRDRAALRIAAGRAALAAGALAALTTAASGGELLDFLRPGSRPATGLGGDPFRSPFREGMSWAGPALDGPRGIRAAAVSSHTLDGHGLPADLHSSRIEWIASGPAPLPGPSFPMAVRVTRPAFEAAWDGPTSGAQLGGATEALDVALESPRWLDRARLRAAFPVAGAGGLGRSPASVELAWLGAHAFALQGGVSWSRTPDPVRARVENEDLRASLNFGTRRYQGDLWGEIRPGLAVEASVSDARIAPLAPRSGLPQYELEPTGGIRTLRGGATWQGPAGSRLLVRRTEFRARLEADASTGGARFGNLNYAHLDARSWLGAAEWPIRRGRALLDFESARGRFQARAEVESWPFTDALADLLGARRIVRGTGSMRWEVIHAGIERSLRRAARVRAGLAWYDLRPEAAVESWRPLFLVFGRTDDTRAELGVRRVQLGELGLGADVLVGGLGLGFDARQVIYGRVLKSGAPEAETPGPVVPEGTAGESARSRSLAGSRIEVRIERKF